MTIQQGANLYTQGFGSRPEDVEIPHLDVRAPTSTDVKYPIGKKWVDTVANVVHELTSLSSAGGTLTANWEISAGGSALLSSLSGDTGTATPTAGNIKLAGTANQIVTSASGSTVTFALTGPYTPATYTAHGVLIGEGTSSIAATAAGTDGQVLTANTGADPAFAAIGTKSGLTAHGVLLAEGAGAFVATAAGATGEALMGNTGADPTYTGSPSFSGSVTAATTITATLGNIQATNGNLVLNTAGNKIVSTSVASTTTAGANSFGTVTLVGGTATVNTTAVTASSLIVLWRQSLGATGANPIGLLTVGTIVANTSFEIHAATTASATTDVATDVSVVGWMIIN